MLKNQVVQAAAKIQKLPMKHQRWAYSTDFRLVVRIIWENICWKGSKFQLVQVNEGESSGTEQFFLEKTGTKY